MTHSQSPPSKAQTFDPRTLTRPDESLLTYYVIVSALTFVGFPFVFVPLYFKYHTLTYRFDDKGISMSWGILWRREIYLTYRRIQDIHVTRNILQRWLGLASVAVQTASGSRGAEMSIEGIRDAHRLRDYLYSQMRGADQAADGGEAVAESTAVGDAAHETESLVPPDSETSDVALQLLIEIRDELRRRNQDLDRQAADASGGESSGGGRS